MQFLDVAKAASAMAGAATALKAAATKAAESSESFIVFL
jgi:hypothetical protein